MTNGEIKAISHDGFKFLHKEPTRNVFSVFHFTEKEYLLKYHADMNKLIG